MKEGLASSGALHDLRGVQGKLKTLLSLMEGAELAELRADYFPLLRHTLADMEKALVLLEQSEGGSR